MSDIVPTGYAELLASLKARIRDAQMRASLSVNREMVLLYWSIGRDILKRQTKEGWGARVIDRLAQDLKAEYPALKGFSPRNLKYMRSFAEAWPEEEIVQGPLAQITWYHNLALLEKIATREQRLWYAQKTTENRWSRNVLAIEIDSGLIDRQGKSITNFEKTLPASQSDLAREIIKDPYKFDFLGIGQEAEERAIEDALILHIQKFLLELGVGFAFVGRQVKLEVAGDEFFIDLLFYHLRLRCFVVIELKAGKFKPEYAGKLNFYLSAADDLLRHPDDSKSIGIILCRTKNEVVAEYALRDLTKPMGVSEFQLARSLPPEFEGALPTPEALELELGDTSEDIAK